MHPEPFAWYAGYTDNAGRRVSDAYARAWAEIAASRAQAVIIDPARAWYASDLVRNDPWLRRGPLVFDIRGLSDPQLAALCKRLSVQVIDAADFHALGIKTARPTADDVGEAPGPERLREDGCPAED